MENLKVIYDLVSMPDYLTLDQMHNIMKNGSIVVWDSSLGGKEPKIIGEHELTTMDIKFFNQEQLTDRFGSLLDD